MIIKRIRLMIIILYAFYTLLLFGCDQSSKQTESLNNFHSESLEIDECRKIAFIAEYMSEWREIYVINSDGTDLKQLTNFTNPEFGDREMVYDLKWSPDGTKILFCVKNLENGYIKTYVIDREGFNKTDFGDYGFDNPQWSPDGKRIVFSSGKDNKLDGYEIYVINADGSGLKQLTNNSLCNSVFCILYNEDPQWSPDGKRIAFVTYENPLWPSPRKIYVMNDDGSHIKILSEKGSDEGNLRWSPDGDSIIFRKYGRYNIVNSDGSNLEELIVKEKKMKKKRCYLSPDLKKVAVIEKRGILFCTYPEVWVMNIDGSDRRRIFYRPKSIIAYANWSPDGKKIAILSYLSYKSSPEICVVNSDGSNLKVLARLKSSYANILANNILNVSFQWCPIIIEPNNNTSR